MGQEVHTKVQKCIPHGNDHKLHLDRSHHW